MMDIKDYAYPTMMAERALKELHNAVLAKRWDDAQRSGAEASRWVDEARDALLEMRKRDAA